jgi:hypothetical protein
MKKNTAVVSLPCMSARFAPQARPAKRKVEQQLTQRGPRFDTLTLDALHNDNPCLDEMLLDQRAMHHSEAVLSY